MEQGKVEAMAKERKQAKGRGLSAAFLCAGLAFTIGAPSAVLALGSPLGEKASGLISGENSLFKFTPASANPHFAELSASHKKTLGFTPGSAAKNAKRSVTVAVRVDANATRAISVRSAMAAAEGTTAAGGSLRLAPTRYNLGLSRGYESFTRATDLSKKLSDAAIPDLAAYQPIRATEEKKPSRFNARIALDEEQKAGRSPRTIDSLGDQTVDLGGSYSLTRNLNVTAGVRYSQDRDRLAPLTDKAEQDSQAVYVGTQFRF